jgi:hypothetical protein
LALPIYCSEFEQYTRGGFLSRNILGRSGKREGKLRKKESNGGEVHSKLRRLLTRFKFPVLLLVIKQQRA